MPFRVLVAALLLACPFAAGAFAHDAKTPTADTASSAWVVPLSGDEPNGYGDDDGQSDQRAQPDDDHSFNLYPDDEDDNDDSARRPDDDDGDSWDIEEPRTERA